MKMIKRAFLTIATLCLFVPVVQANVTEVNAINTGDYGIHQGCVFDVDVVNDQGGFDHKGCYNNFDEAKKAMHSLGQDAVVRNNASKSPTKIVAMTNGIVISNPYRTGDSLSYYYERGDFTGSTTYSQQYMQGKYNGTASYNSGNGSGSVALTMNGFEGYIRMENCDLVPIKYFTNHLPIILGGNNNEDPQYTIYPEMNKYVCGTDNAGNKELYFYSYWGWSNSVQVPSSTNATPNRQGVSLSAADWMQPGTTYYSYNGYDFYTDMAMNNKAGTYYDYYQFLPARTKSNITGADFNNYLMGKGYTAGRSAMYGTGDTFVSAQNTYGVNALLVYALAIQESGFGTSNLALTRNNLFGWNAVDSNPNNASYFGSVGQAINEHMHTNLNGYLDVDDSRHFGMQIGNKGNGFNVKYASDAYWGINIAHYAYDIDKYTGFKDRYKTTVGVVSSSTDVWFNRSSTDNSHFFNIKNPGGTYYEKAYTVTILGEANGKYKIQSSDHLINGNLTRASAYNGREYSNGKAYNWDAYVAWINKDYVTVLTNGTPAGSVDVPETDDNTGGYPDSVIEAISTFDLERGVTDVSVENDTVTIKGLGYISGAKADDENSVKHYVVLENTETGEKTEFEAKSVLNEEMSTKFWKHYKYVNYEAVFSIKDLQPGNYTINLRVVNGEYDITKDLQFNIDKKNYKYSGDDGYTTRVFSDSLFRNRLSISKEIESADLKLDEVTRPSWRKTVLGTAGISVENGHLTVSDGYVYMIDADQKADLNPILTFYLEDDNGNLTSFTATLKDSTRDFATITSSDKDLSFASYDLDADLTNLAPGHYRLWTSITTDEYRDVFETYSLDRTNYSGSTDTKTFELVRSNTRYRYELTVEEIG